MTSDLSPLDLHPAAGGIQLTVKVVPGASRTRIVGLLGAALKIAVSAPPEAGQANKAVLRLLADALAVKPADVTVVAGASRPSKRIAVAGLDAATVRARLALALR